MDSPEIPPAAGAPGKRVVQLQGPRPSPLSLNKQSRQIAKPGAAPKPPLPARLPAPERLEPMIIYDVSPKPICVDASDFKSVVQRLTGLGSGSAAGPTSPAARAAAMEKVSPPGRERGTEALNDGFELMNLGQIPGILSPAPANLPALPAGMFSPAVLAGTQENPMSPFRNYFFPSPNSSSYLFAGGFDFSPNPSPVIDFSTIFDS